MILCLFCKKVLDLAILATIVYVASIVWIHYLCVLNFIDALVGIAIRLAYSKYMGINWVHLFDFSHLHTHQQQINVWSPTLPLSFLQQVALTVSWLTPVTERLSNVSSTLLFLHASVDCWRLTPVKERLDLWYMVDINSKIMYSSAAAAAVGGVNHWDNNNLPMLWSAWNVVDKWHHGM